MKQVSLLIALLVAAAPAAARFKQPVYEGEKLFFSYWAGQEILRGTLYWAWKHCDYPDLEYGIYYREQNFYFVPDKSEISKLPGIKPHDGFFPTYEDGRIFVTTIIPDTYEDGDIIPQTHTSAGPPKKIFGALPEHFEEYLGGSVSMRVEATLTNYLLEVYPGGGDRFEQSARITSFTLLPESKSSLTLTSYREDSYPMAFYKSKDSYINIRDRANDAVVHKIYKKSFIRGDILLLEGDEGVPWLRILYRKGDDFFPGYVHSSQVGFDPADLL